MTAFRTTSLKPDLDKVIVCEVVPVPLTELVTPLPDAFAVIVGAFKSVFVVSKLATTVEVATVVPAPFFQVTLQVWLVVFGLKLPVAYLLHATVVAPSTVAVAVTLALAYAAAENPAKPVILKSLAEYSVFVITPVVVLIPLPEKYPLIVAILGLA